MKCRNNGNSYQTGIVTGARYFETEDDAEVSDYGLI
jgi:hypothetical protein